LDAQGRRRRVPEHETIRRVDDRRETRRRLIERRAHLLFVDI
jgi:hypothetical protein